MGSHSLLPLIIYRSVILNEECPEILRQKFQKDPRFQNTKQGE